MYVSAHLINAVRYVSNTHRRDTLGGSFLRTLTPFLRSLRTGPPLLLEAPLTAGSVIFIHTFTLYLIFSHPSTGISILLFVRRTSSHLEDKDEPEWDE